MLFKRVVIIDIGSNSTKIVCYDVNNDMKIGNVREIKWTNRIIQNVINNNYNISDHLISKTIDWLKQTIKWIEEQMQIIENWSCKYKCTLTYICFATEGIRKAKNYETFLERLKTETGLECKVLSAKEEINAGINAVRTSLNIKEGIVIDIGGGSTEIGFYNEYNNKTEYFISLPVGAVSLMCEYDLDKPCSSEFIDKIRKKLIDTYSFNILRLKNSIINEIFNKDEEKFSSINFIAIGGTAKHIGRIVHGSNYLEQKESLTIDIKNIKKTTYNVLIRDIIDRKYILGIKSKRADILGAGSLILLCLMDILKIDEISMTKVGVREGIVIESIKNL